METILGHGAIESTPSHLDVTEANVQAAVGATSFQVEYTVNHDNQRAIGICTMAHLADVLYQMYGVEVSEQFGYVEGKIKYDGNMYEGSSIKTMLEFARVVGLPKKSLVPTDDTHKNFNDYTSVTFSPEAWADASNQKLPGYYKINDLSLQSLINEGAKSKYGLSIMIRVGNNWYTDANGNITWDGSKLSPLRAGKPYSSAHATKIISLNIDKEGNIRNTWGDKNNPIYQPNGVWGNNGDINFNWDTISGDIVEAWGFLDKPVSEIFTHTFSTPIKYGDRNSEVTALQRVLTRLGFYNYAITGFYGNITTAAVLAFQHSKGITTGDGKNVGPLTIKQLNS